MSLISEAVHERAGAVFECRNDSGGNENCAERRVTAGDSLAYQNHIRLDAPMPRSKRLSRTAHAGHNFVCYQENSVSVADFRYARGVTFGRYCGAECGTDDRFKDEGRGFLGFVLKKMDFEIIGADEFALRKGFFERTVITETGSNVAPFREERFVRRAAGHVSADGHRTKSAAVIALAAGENAVAILPAAFQVKLPREFYRGFSGFRAAGREIDAAAVAEIRRSHREQALGKFFRWRGMKLRSVRESDLRRLLRHCAPDFRNTVTDTDNGGLPGSIKKAVTAAVHDPATFPARGNRKGFLEITGEKSAARRHEISGKEL